MSEGRTSRVDDDTGADGGAPALDLTRYRARRIRERLLLNVERLLRAVQQRDVDRVWKLLDDAEAYRCIPANVREEALVMSQLPRTSLRAPIRIYRFQYLLSRLDDEPLDALDSTPEQQQLALDLTPLPPPVLAGPSRVRELAFRDRRSPHGGTPRRGPDRRRAESR